MTGLSAVLPKVEPFLLSMTKKTLRTCITYWMKISEKHNSEVANHPVSIFSVHSLLLYDLVKNLILIGQFRLSSYLIVDCC